ncbi:hypothetical protein IP81_08125 [Novosphingobium sp. AAP83]|uniref:hypothetical protein n=1 Tax=Novosphingobium sp. AAP83 TaxID=1523425 RepID=UPI0006B99E11|nr:hypothetical protein [Novosphingobium sp. AAP83]KPF92000.1 hypothetical protein IP81_08125 [Novosphingobium sp. AAP83]
MMRRLAAISAVAVGVLLLAGCMLLPGKFTSELDLRKDGTFSFAYKGEIHLLALSKMAADKRNNEDAEEVFAPSACYTDSSGEERACSKNEIADQKANWEEQRAIAKENVAQKKKSEEAMMKSMLGGIDPADPRAAQEFAERLRRQHGWKSVIDKGDGRFEVDYAITGRLDHDFTFPMIEKLPMVTPFVTLIRRNDGSVRLEAPAFSSAATSSPMMGMAAASANNGGADSMPTLDGLLTLVTDGDILTNNTDDGPIPVPRGQKLVWKVNARTAAAPAALVRTGS